MNELKPTIVNNSDLYNLIQIIWDGKWKIIICIFVSLLIAILYSITKPNSYYVSTTVQKGKSSVFIDYTAINDVLRENNIFLSDENASGYKIDAKDVFQIFLSEFGDYEEMINILKTDKFVLKSIESLDDEEKYKSLLNYAKSFEILPPPRKKKNWILAFEWHDYERGLYLFEEALKLTLQTVQKTIFNDINQLATAIDMKSQRSLEILNSDLELIKLTEEERQEKYIQFLIEQAAIAKELGIATNQLDAYSLNQTGQTGVSMTISLNEVPFYLRGFNAINKEIEILRSRTQEVKLLMADGYLETKEKILSLENNPSASQLRNTLTTIQNDDPSDWIEFNLGLAEITSQSNTKIYIIFAIFFGGVVGLLYVLILNAIYNRNLQITKE